MAYELPAAPLSIGGVLDSAIRLFRDSMSKYWILALLYALVTALFSIFLALSIPDIGTAPVKDPRRIFAALFSPASLAGFAVTIVVSLVFYGALVKTISAWAKGDESLSLGSALAIGVRRLPGLLLGFVLSALITLIGFVLLVIPGIYFMGKLPLWVPAMFMDEASAVDALGISWRLTSGRWWRGSIILTVALILLYVFSLALGFVAGIIIKVAHLSATDNAIIQQLFTAVANVFVLPMFVTIVIVMYHDFKLRSEGGDLAARMETLGKT